MYLLFIFVYLFIFQIEGGSLVPPKLSIPLLLKVVFYDRNFLTKTDAPIHLAIIYEQSVSKSYRMKNQIIRDFEESQTKQIKNRDFNVFYFECDSLLESNLKANKINVLFVTPIQKSTLTDILKLTNELKIISTTNTVNYIEEGVSLGVKNVGGRPRILINLPSSRAEGMDIQSQLLKISEVIK